MKWCAIYLLILVLWSSSSIWAQNEIATPEPQAKKQVGQKAKIRMEVERRGVGEQSRVRIMLKDKNEVKGYISQLDADSFQVTDKKGGQARTIEYADVERVRGPGLSRGAKIGIAVGVAGAVLGIAAATLPKD